MQGQKTLILSSLSEILCPNGCVNKNWIELMDYWAKFEFVILRLWVLIAVVSVEATHADMAEKIQVPEGFEVKVFSDKVPNARSMALGDGGIVYVGSRTEGKVYALKDSNNDGMADQVYIIASDLTLPNGVAYLDGSLYVAEVPRLIRFNGITSKLNKPPPFEIVYDWFPTKLHHGWKYLRVGPDGMLYLPIGAPCNVCREKKEIFATIMRISPEGDDLEIVARGVRNSVGFDWHPQSGAMFFSDNGRDWMGDDLPPDELNHLSSDDLHFGFPFCHGDRYLDTEFGIDDSCTNYTPPAWLFPAHSAPLGIRFYTGDQFPKEYKNQLFVAQHGSWNRSEPVGYRIVLVKFKNAKPVASKIFAKGWLDASNVVRGRPVDLLQLPDGSLLVSDDKNGAIYRISYPSNHNSR